MERRFTNLIAGLAGLVALSVPLRTVADSTSLDGHWWQKVPDSAKVYVVPCLTDYGIYVLTSRRPSVSATIYKVIQL